MMEIVIVDNPNQLDILSDKTANFGELNFKFSPKYLAELKSLVNKSLQYIATIDGNFAGYLAAKESDIWPDSFQIVELFVDPSAQRKGVASSLLGKLFTDAHCQLVVETEKENLPAITLYKKHGFEEVENENWDDITLVRNDNK
ncbi:MAG: N-acetyltransferase [Candidatus Berkelbacteria bacterium]|nr:N-acetyltransferase [Candidatus Berkelbacteria bacterium]